MNNINLPFKEAFNGLHKVTLGGVVQKIVIIVVPAIVGLIAIAWISKNIWLESFISGGIVVLLFFLPTKLINFANNNPQAALLEGAQFLKYEEMVSERKGIGKFSPSPEIIQPEPIEGPDANPEIAQIPDQETNSMSLEGGSEQ